MGHVSSENIECETIAQLDSLSQSYLMHSYEVEFLSYEIAWWAGYTMQCADMETIKVNYKLKMSFQFGQKL